MARFALSLMAATLVLAISAPGHAEKKAPNPELTVGQCLAGGGEVAQPEGSAIRTCCMYSDITGIKGCYICDYKWENCEWDPSYASHTQGRPGLLQGGTLTVAPQPTGKPKFSPAVKQPGTFAPAQ